MTDRLVRQGWSKQRAAEAAEYRYSGRSALGRWAHATGPEIRVPDLTQRTNYTCGPASLSAALHALGVPVPEDTLAAEAGTTAAGGTSAAGLAEAAELHGVTAGIFEGMTVDDVEECIKAGRVVIACLQARDDPDNDYSHWVVPFAVKQEASGIVVECMDPGIEGAHSVLPIDEWEERWYGYDEGEQTTGLGVVLVGRNPSRTALDLARMIMR